jgi:transcriptional regulator with XRE-family HTH domain
MELNQFEVEEIFALPAEKEEVEVWEAFGRRIALRRGEMGWTRVELAKEMEISRERLAKWERGENGPSPFLLIRLAVTLGMTIDELMTGKRLEPGTQAMTDEQRRELAGCLERLTRLLGKL